RSGAAALRARDRQLDGHLRLGSAQRVIERETHLGLDVGATHRLLPRTTSGGAAAEDVAEASPEDVAEVEVAEVDVDAAWARPRRAAAVRRAEAVVCLPLLGVREDVVRGLHLLEALLGALVPLVRVRVELARELAVRLLDLVGRRALLDAERVVERLRHRPRAPPAPAARRRRQPERVARRARRACSPSARRRSPSPPRPPRAGRGAPRARAGRTDPPSRSASRRVARA